MGSRYLLLVLGNSCSALDVLHDAGRTSSASGLSVGQDHAMFASQSRDVVRKTEACKSEDADDLGIPQTSKISIRYVKSFTLTDFRQTAIRPKGYLQHRKYNLYKDSHGNQYAVKYGKKIAFIDSAAVYGFDGAEKLEKTVIDSLTSKFLSYPQYGDFRNVTGDDMSKISVYAKDTHDLFFKMLKSSHPTLGTKSLKTIQAKLDHLATSVNSHGVKFRFMFRRLLDFSDDLQSIAVYNQGYADFISDERYVLCVVVDDRCASSIQTDIEGKTNELHIDSRTDFRYEGRGLNSLARCVSFIAFSFIKNVNAIISEPVNAVSSYNLGKVFDVSIWAAIRYKRLHISVPTSVPEWEALMESIENEDDFIFIKVDQTKENIQRAARYISNWKYRHT